MPFPFLLLVTVSIRNSLTDTILLFSLTIIYLLFSLTASVDRNMSQYLKFGNSFSSVSYNFDIFIEEFVLYRF